MKDGEGHSLFGAIEQEVVALDRAEARPASGFAPVQ
jgi:fumarylacetoacetate (FAA) hydrolase